MAYPEYIRASNGEGEAVRAIVVTEREIGHTLINVDSVTNWPAKFIATSGVLDFQTGLMDPNTLCVFYGSLAGGMINIEGYAPGYYDKGHQPDEVIVLKPTTAWADELVEAIGEIDGLPEGGTTGQSLIKKSNADGDVEWSPRLTEADVFLMSHPVGSTYWNGTDSRNPGTVWGGTWVALEGVVLGGISTVSGSPFNVAAGNVIGADTHTLTSSQTPVVEINNPGGRQWRSTNAKYDVGNFDSSPANYHLLISSGGSEAGNLQTQGGGQAHPIIQRTKVGYLWQRTA